MKKESNSQLALNAMQRASKKAVEKAANLDLSIPVWTDACPMVIKKLSISLMINFLNLLISILRGGQMVIIAILMQVLGKMQDIKSMK